MGIKLTFTIGGRSVSAQQFEKDLEKALVAAGNAETEKRVRAARCPVHQRTARVTATGASTDRRLTVEPCCEKWKDGAAKQFR
jgi:hypothetical protein